MRVQRINQSLNTVWQVQGNKIDLGKFLKLNKISRFSTKNFDEDQSIKGVYTERLTTLWWRFKLKAGGGNEMLQPSSERGRKKCIWSMFCLKKTIKTPLEEAVQLKKKRNRKQDSYSSKNTQLERNKTSSPLVHPTGKPHKGKQI